MLSNLFSTMLRLVSLLALVVLSFGHPINREFNDNKVDQLMANTPKWYNHCKVKPASSHHSSHGVSQLKRLSIIKELFHKIEKSAHISMRRAEDFKRKFVDLEDVFNNFEGLRLKSGFEWLPEIPPVSEEAFDDMTKENALFKAHEYIEKFAVALEQIVIDQNNRNIDDVYSDEIDSQHFKNIDDDNYSVLCEIRITMSVVFVSEDESFITQTDRTLMPEEDRHIREPSKRMLRDYLILRQYVKTIHFISKLFEYIRQKL